MAHTNSTTNYSLPQFITTDKPAWLTDINGAFSDIDTAVYTAQTKADAAYNNAGTAQADATSALTNAAAADAKGSGALASIEAAFDPTTIYSVGAKVIYNSLLYRCVVAVVTPGPWTGSDNWERITVDTLISTADSKIGSLGSLSTSDKTSTVNAINEVNGKVGALGTTIDISVQFTKSANYTGDFFCRAYYNTGTKRVSGMVSVNSTTAIGTGINFMNIGADYRPSSNMGFPMLIRTTTGTLPYVGYMNSAGTTTQTASNNTTGVYFYFEYYL